MDTKYYIPLLEEFYIGFEYEFLEWNHTIWTNETFKQDSHITIYDDGEYSCDLESYLKADRIRVKYLDKEDIESFGFIKKPQNASYDKGDFLRIFWYENNILSIRKGFYYMDNSIFIGRIKNKSELKVLLKQLDII